MKVTEKKKKKRKRKAFKRKCSTDSFSVFTRFAIQSLAPTRTTPNGTTENKKKKKGTLPPFTHIFMAIKKKKKKEREVLTK